MHMLLFEYDLNLKAHVLEVDVQGYSADMVEPLTFNL